MRRGLKESLTTHGSLFVRSLRVIWRWLRSRCRGKVKDDEGRLGFEKGRMGLDLQVLVTRVWAQALVQGGQQS